MSANIREDGGGIAEEGIKQIGEDIPAEDIDDFLLPAEAAGGRNG
ncbi:hypothetical protein [Rhizobium sp. AN80A]|nr:hypothetical protein [Rhizobium sp. AN80A]